MIYAEDPTIKAIHRRLEALEQAVRTLHTPVATPEPPPAPPVPDEAPAPEEIKVLIDIEATPPGEILIKEGK